MASPRRLSGESDIQDRIRRHFYELRHSEPGLTREQAFQRAVAAAQAEVGSSSTTPPSVANRRHTAAAATSLAGTSTSSRSGSGRIVVGPDPTGHRSPPTPSTPLAHHHTPAQSPSPSRPVSRQSRTPSPANSAIRQNKGKSKPKRKGAGRTVKRTPQERAADAQRRSMVRDYMTKALENSMIMWKRQHPRGRYHDFLKDTVPENIELDAQGRVVWVDERLQGPKWKGSFRSVSAASSLHELELLSPEPEQEEDQRGRHTRQQQSREQEEQQQIEPDEFGSRGQSSPVDDEGKAVDLQQVVQSFRALFGPDEDKQTKPQEAKPGTLSADRGTAVEAVARDTAAAAQVVSDTRRWGVDFWFLTVDREDGGTADSAEEEYLDDENDNVLSGGSDDQSDAEDGKDYTNHNRGSGRQDGIRNMSRNSKTNNIVALSSSDSDDAWPRGRAKPSQSSKTMLRRLPPGVSLPRANVSTSDEDDSTDDCDTTYDVSGGLGLDGVSGASSQRSKSMTLEQPPMESPLSSMVRRMTDFVGLPDFNSWTNGKGFSVDLGLMTLEQAGSESSGDDDSGDDTESSVDGSDDAEEENVGTPIKSQLLGISAPVPAQRAQQPKSEIASRAIRSAEATAVVTSQVKAAKSQIADVSESRSRHGNIGTVSTSSPSRPPLPPRVHAAASASLARSNSIERLREGSQQSTSASASVHGSVPSSTAGTASASTSDLAPVAGSVLPAAPSQIPAAETLTTPRVTAADISSVVLAHYPMAARRYQQQRAQAKASRAQPNGRTGARSENVNRSMQLERRHTTASLTDTSVMRLARRNLVGQEGIDLGAACEEDPGTV